jgi:hypothetical protein
MKMAYFRDGSAVIEMVVPPSRSALSECVRHKGRHSVRRQFIFPASGNCIEPNIASVGGEVTSRSPGAR